MSLLHPDRRHAARRKEAEGNFILAIVHGITDFFLSILGISGKTEAQKSRETEMLDEAERARREMRDRQDDER